MKFSSSPKKFNNSSQFDGVGRENLSREDIKELPMDRAKDSFLESVENNPSTILIGETGSGKTTRTPHYLLEAFPEAKIAFTSPRVLPALSVSEYVAENRGQRVGREVGVITRQERNISDETRLMFMTDGILLSMFKKDPMLMDFDIVTIDEAHERSLNIDLCLGLLKRAQKTRKEKGEKELKIIIASATIEEQKFVDYFDDVPPLKVPGRMYPVDVEYVSFQKDSYGKIENEELTAAKVVKRIIAHGKEGDILVFMPGEEEIRKTIEEIVVQIGSHDSIEVLPLYGSMQKDDQKKVFSKNGKRKVIVSTNIAETSVTIPGVKHVIDTGTVKQKNYNPITGIDELKLIETSQANMNQRKGRAGRTSPGTCYRLMSEEDFNRRDPFQTPEILRANLEETVLRMKDMDIDDVVDFDFIDKPSKASLNMALANLKKLGALDEEGKITQMGEEMSHLQLRPDLSRMLIEAKNIGALEGMVNLCSLISATKQIMIRGDARGKSDDELTKLYEQQDRQKTLRVSKSDPLTLLNVWKKWEESGYSGPFAYDHLLNKKALDEVGLTRLQLVKNLAEGGMQVEHSDKDIDKDAMVRCLLAGAPDALFYCSDFGDKRFYQPFNNDPALRGTQIFPGSSLFKQGGTLMLALNVSRSEQQKKDRFTGALIKTSTLYARMCHSITITELEKIKPGSVVEKKEGEPRYSYSTNGYEQTYGVYVLGVRVDTITKPVEGYEPPRYERSVGGILRQGRSYYDRYESPSTRSESFIVSPITVENLLPDIAIKNYATRKYLESYKIRGGPSISYTDQQERILASQNFFYEELIARFAITTKEELLEHKEDFEIKLGDFISQEKMDFIDKDCPNTISHDGVVFAVGYTYDINKDGFRTATVSIADPKDIEALVTAEIPSFKAMDRIIFSLSYIPAQSVSYRYNYGQSRSTVQFSTIEELKEYNEQYKKAEAKRARRHERKGDTVVSQSSYEEAFAKTMESIPIKESQEKTPEKVEVIKLEVVDIRNLLAYLRNFTQGKNERELKDKTKILDRLKEVSARSVEIAKKIEENGSDFDMGSLGELLTAVRALIKRLGFSPAKAEQLPYLYKHNLNLLREALERNEVKEEDGLLKKIVNKSIERAFESDTLFNTDEADEVIIELV